VAPEGSPERLLDPAYWLERAAAACERVADWAARSDLRRCLARAYIQAGDLAQARDQLEEARETPFSDKEWAKTLVRLSAIEAARGIDADAIDAAQRLRGLEVRSWAFGTIALARARSDARPAATSSPEPLPRFLSSLAPEDQFTIIGMMLSACFERRISSGCAATLHFRERLCALLDDFWTEVPGKAGSDLEGFLSGEGADPSTYHKLALLRFLSRGGKTGELERWSAGVSRLEPRFEVSACLSAAKALEAEERRKVRPELP
jgi:hypothetical protein